MPPRVRMSDFLKAMKRTKVEYLASHLVKGHEIVLPKKRSAIESVPYLVLTSIIVVVGVFTVVATITTWRASGPLAATKPALAGTILLSAMRIIFRRACCRVALSLNGKELSITEGLVNGKTTVIDACNCNSVVTENGYVVVTMRDGSRYQFGKGLSPDELDLMAGLLEEAVGNVQDPSVE